MKLGILPQVIVIAFWIAKIGIHAINNGEEVKNPQTKYCLWKVAVTVMINAAVLYAGGFWDVLLK